MGGGGCVASRVVWRACFAVRRCAGSMVEVWVMKLFGIVRNVLPVHGWFEAVIGVDDGLHFFHGGISVEGGCSRRGGSR